MISKNKSCSIAFVKEDGRSNSCSKQSFKNDWMTYMVKGHYYFNSKRFGKHLKSASMLQVPQNLIISRGQNLFLELGHSIDVTYKVLHYI